MTDNNAGPIKTVSVQASYQLRIGLRKGSVFSLQLQDVALQDAPAVCIARQDIVSSNARHDIELRYDERELDLRGRFQLQATIHHEGRLQFIGFTDANLAEPDTPHRLIMHMTGA